MTNDHSHDTVAGPTPPHLLHATAGDEIVPVHLRHLRSKLADADMHARAALDGFADLFGPAMAAPLRPLLDRLSGIAQTAIDQAVTNNRMVSSADQRIADLLGKMDNAWIELAVAHEQRDIAQAAGDDHFADVQRLRAALHLATAVGEAARQGESNALSMASQAMVTSPAGSTDEAQDLATVGPMSDRLAPGVDVIAAAGPIADAIDPGRRVA